MLKSERGFGHSSSMLHRVLHQLSKKVCLMLAKTPFLMTRTEDDAVHAAWCIPRPSPIFLCTKSAPTHSTEEMAPVCRTWMQKQNLLHWTVRHPMVILLETEVGCAGGSSLNAVLIKFAAYSHDGSEREVESDVQQFGWAAFRSDNPTYV